MATPTSIKMITNFNLYILQLLLSFSDNFVDAVVENAQSGEVYTLKKSGRATLRKESDHSL